MTSNAGHVFISHGSDNRAEAEEISAFLEGRGIRTWIAPRDVRPGMDYSEQLQSSIEECIAFVVLVTDTANTSPYVRAETEMAFSNNKPIFPVRRSDIKPAAGLAFFLKIRHWTDAFGGNAEANMDRLARELRTLSGLPDEAPAAPGPQPPPSPLPSPPPPPPPPPAGETGPPQTDALADEARLRAAIGPNSDYYLGRWRAMDEKSNVLSWNWPACLVSIFWFAYRKMWLPMAAMVFAILLLGVLGAASPELGKVTMIVSILLTFVTGAIGNYLYRRQIVALAADPALGPAELAARGGVSKTALIASAATVFVLTAIVVVALAMQELERQKQLPQPAPPVDPTLNVLGGDKPADAGQAGGTQAAGIDASLVVGRWTDTGDCANAVEYTADGRIVAPDGSTGLWQLDGDQLTMTGPDGSRTVRITSIDQSAAYAVNPDGSVEASQRC